MNKITIVNILLLTIFLSTLANAKENKICQLFIDEKIDNARVLLDNLSKDQISNIQCYKESILNIAATIGDEKTAKLLLKKGIKPSVKDLRDAIKGRHESLVKILAKQVQIEKKYDASTIFTDQLGYLGTAYEADKFMSKLSSALIDLQYHVRDPKCLQRMAVDDTLWKVINKHLSDKIKIELPLSPTFDFINILLKKRPALFQYANNFYFERTFIEKNQPEKLKLFLKYGYRPSKKVLTRAIEFGNFETVKLLVEHGSLDAKAFKTKLFDDDAPLRKAVEYNRDNILDYLTKNNFRFGKMTRNSYISNANYYKEQNYKEIEEKIKNSQPISEYTFRSAIHKGDLKTVQLITAHKVKWEEKKFDTDPIAEAIRYRQEEVLQHFLKEGKYPVNHKLLEDAIDQRRIDLLELFTDRGIKIDMKEECSIICEVLRTNYSSKTLEFFLKKGANPLHLSNQYNEYSWGKTPKCQYPIGYAVSDNNMNALKLLLKYAKSDLGVLSSQTVIETAIRNRNLEMAKLLKKHGAKLNVENYLPQSQIKNPIKYKEIFSKL